MESPEGDPIRRTFDASYRRLVSQLYGVCGDLAEAEDVVAEAFVIAVSRRAAFERLDRPEAWLRTVAVNLARTRYRRRQLGERLIGRVEERDAVSVSTASDDRLTVIDALKSLPREQREALALHYLADLPVAEVAEAVGAPVGTVKARLSRGRAALAAALIVEDDVAGDVAAPDYNRLVERGQRRRTVRTAAVAGTVALAVLLILGFAQLLNDGRGDASPPPVAPSPTPSKDPVTEEDNLGACMRFAGSVGTRHREEPVVLTTDCATEPLTADLASDKSAYALAMSPDRTMISYSVSTPGTPDQLQVLSVATGETRTIATSSDTITGQAWSPDSTRIAITRYEGGVPNLLIADLAANTVQPISGDPSGSSPSWSPDGAQLAFSRENDRPEILSLASGQRRELERAPLEEPIAWTGDADALFAIEYSEPDGKGAPPQFRVHRLDPVTGAIQMTSPWLPGRPQDFTGDNGNIVVAAVTQELDPVTAVSTLDPSLGVVARVPIGGIELTDLTLSPVNGAAPPSGPPSPTQSPSNLSPQGAPSFPQASKDLRRIAEHFLQFARGQSDSVPADTPVAFYIGGRLAKTIPTDDLTNPAAWQACPAAGTYAAHLCPVSALTQLARWPGRIALTSIPPNHACANPTALPPSTNVYRAMTLTPKAHFDCTNYFAVQLLANDVGQIVAVNIVWAEP